MLWQWKLASLLGLLENIEDRLNRSSLGENDGDPGKRKKDSKYFSGLPDKPGKSWITRGLTLGFTIGILYLIFGFSAPRYISIKSLSCASNKLKISAAADYTLPEFNNQSLYHAYASKIGHGQNEDVYEIYLYPENSLQKIAFRVTKTLYNSSAGIFTSGYSKWAYNTGVTTYYRKVECEKNSNGKDCCCSKKGECSCESSSSSTCACSNGSSSTGCACCALMKWIDLAILNLENPGRATPASIFFSLLPTLLYLSFFFFMARSAMKGQGMGFYPGGLFKMGQSMGKMTKSKITFSDVGGLEEEKQELEEIVDYLKRPNKYKALGARMPRGVILYGPPGTGKTLLAKAVSGEANVPFMEVAGSTFDDMYVGSGAKRVRDLFAKARKMAPCIIFIDEIDAVAGKRGNKFVSGGGAYDQTINQLLSEMDGFNTVAGIVIIAATNRLDSIDDAILRPGRFDRHVQVSLPNIKDRIGILKLHSSNKNLSSNVDLEDIARKTPGFSGAQLENVLNEATLLAVRENKKAVSKYHVEEAIDRVISGIAKKSHRMCDMDRKLVAYHEAGHALAGLYSEEGDMVERITIIPRGQAGGYVLSAPKKQETFIKRKDELLSIVLTTLAGRASEEIFFGPEKITSGAANDLFKVTNLVRKMISQLGMSDRLGLQQYEPSEGLENPYRKNYSDKYSQMIDEEVEKIIGEQYKKAKQLILDNREELLLIVECLLLIETIDRNQINYIHEFKQLPKDALDIKEKLLSEGKEIDISPDKENIIIETEIVEDV